VGVEEAWDMRCDDPLSLVLFRLDFLRATTKLLGEGELAVEELLALLLRCEGYSSHESAELLNCSASAVAGMVQRSSEKIAGSGVFDAH